MTCWMKYVCAEMSEAYSSGQTVDWGPASSKMYLFICLSLLYNGCIFEQI